MRIYIIPREYVEVTTVRGGDFDGYFELPWKNEKPDYSVASGWVSATWYQHIYHTAHVALKPAAAKRIREAIARGDRLEFCDGPEHARTYTLYESSEDGCPHCEAKSTELDIDALCKSAATR